MTSTFTAVLHREETAYAPRNRSLLRRDGAVCVVPLHDELAVGHTKRSFAPHRDIFRGVPEKRIVPGRSTRLTGLKLR